MPRQHHKRLVTVTRGGLIGTAVVFLAVVVCVRLGFWQLARLEQKRARNAAAQIRLAAPPLTLTSIAPDSTGLIFRRVIVSGTYDDARTVVVAGRAFNGSPGVHVLTPLRVGSSAVLVNRGWMPSADGAHVDLASISEPSPHSARGMIIDLAHDPRAAPQDTATRFRRIWYHAGIPAMRRQFPYPIADYIVQLLPSTDAPKYPIRLRPPELDEGPHMGYAVQWFSFAAIAVIGWFIMVFRRKGRPE